MQIFSTSASAYLGVDRFRTVVQLVPVAPGWAVGAVEFTRRSDMSPLAVLFSIMFMWLALEDDRPNYSYQHARFGKKRQRHARRRIK